MALLMILLFCLLSIATGLAIVGFTYWRTRVDLSHYDLEELNNQIEDQLRS
jgi:hypothetical protein